MNEVQKKHFDSLVVKERLKIKRIESRRKPMFACEYCWKHFGTDDKPMVAYHSSDGCPNKPFNPRR